MTDAFAVRGYVLPEGERREVFVVEGRITFEPVADADVAAEGWIVPGLVDAHCHVGLDENGAVPDDVAEQQALDDRATGTLLMRDAGSPADTRWIDDRADLPRIIRAGRHIARTKRYIRNYGHEIEPAELPDYVAMEAKRGDGWVKLVGDWIDRDAGDLTPCWPRDAVEAAIETAHAHGARVTAHVFGEDALPDLIESGIDCIEHGTGLSADLVDAMASRGIALVPTAVQVDNFPQYAAAGESRYPTYARHMRDLHARRRETIRGAYEAGVPIYAGSDSGGALPHGIIASEVQALAGYGIGAADALGAASWRAREWLGRESTLSEGAEADFVVYPRNPLDDLRVLEQPARIVLRGRIVA